MAVRLHIALTCAELARPGCQPVAPGQLAAAPPVRHPWAEGVGACHAGACSAQHGMARAGRFAIALLHIAAVAHAYAPMPRGRGRGHANGGDWDPAAAAAADEPKSGGGDGARGYVPLPPAPPLPALPVLALPQLTRGQMLQLWGHLPDEVARGGARHGAWPGRRPSRS